MNKRCFFSPKTTNLLKPKNHCTNSNMRDTCPCEPLVSYFIILLSESVSSSMVFFQTHPMEIWSKYLYSKVFVHIISGCKINYGLTKWSVWHLLCTKLEIYVFKRIFGRHTVTWFTEIFPAHDKILSGLVFYMRTFTLHDPDTFYHGKLWLTGNWPIINPWLEWYS
jgi:hypothetical protein